MTMIQELKGWAISFLKEMAPELIAEFLSYNGLKKVLMKGRQETEKKAGEPGAKTDTSPEIKHGGIFDLSDEIAYIKMVAILESDATATEVVKNVSAYLASLPHNWQRRVFRASVGSLCCAEFVKEVKITETKIPSKRGGSKLEKTSREIRTNLAVEFMKGFAKCSNEEKMNICKAAGLMTSPFEEAKKSFKKFNRFVTKNEQCLINGINQVSNTVGVPQRRSFFDILFGRN